MTSKQFRLRAKSESFSLSQSVPSIFHISIITINRTNPSQHGTSQEQPLLLEELLEQEKREQLQHTPSVDQQQQQQQQGHPLLSEQDFERLKADVLSGGAAGNRAAVPSPPQGVPGNIIGIS